MNWQDASEIVAGLVLANRISQNSIRSELFMPPYNDIIKAYKNGKIEPEFLISKFGLSPIQTAHEAAKSLNGLGEADWIGILENTASFYSAGVDLEKIAKKLQRGDDVDLSSLTTIAQKATKNQASVFTPMSEVVAGEVPFVTTGWSAIDDHLGGIPETGLIVVGGNPGVGKTTFASRLVTKFVRQHPDKNIAFFSLEMILPELKRRIVEVDGHLTKEEEKRIMLSELTVSPEECINHAATLDKLGLVIVDFADLMINGETNESAMAHIYRTLMKGAKNLRVPILLLSQLNRAYTGGIPRPTNLRWTGLAEALSWMILMLYNPSENFFSNSNKEEETLPTMENRAYICAWKVRGGFRLHRDDSPGAICVPWRADKGWGNKGTWFSLRKIA